MGTAIEESIVRWKNIEKEPNEHSAIIVVSLANALIPGLKRRGLLTPDSLRIDHLDADS